MFEFGDNRFGSDSQQLSKEHARGLSFSFLWEGMDRTPAQAALRFVLDQPGVTAVIPGTKKMEHLEDNAGATDVTSLTEEEMKRVAEVDPLYQNQMLCSWNEADTAQYAQLGASRAVR